MKTAADEILLDASTVRLIGQWEHESLQPARADIDQQIEDCWFTHECWDGWHRVDNA